MISVPIGNKISNRIIRETENDKVTAVNAD